MENLLKEMKNRVLAGELLSKEDALQLAEMPLDPLCDAADEIRQKFCGNEFDLCTIINGKNGKCSENCKYCAQSAFYSTEVESYPLMNTDQLLEQAKYNAEQGVLRYSIVTSGKRLSDREVDAVCESIRALRKAFCRACVARRGGWSWTGYCHTASDCARRWRCSGCLA